MNKAIRVILSIIFVSVFVVSIGCFFGFLPGGIAVGATLLFILLVCVIAADQIVNGDTVYVSYGKPGKGAYYSTKDHEKLMNDYRDQGIY